MCLPVFFWPPSIGDIISQSLLINFMKDPKNLFLIHQNQMEPWRWWQTGWPPCLTKACHMSTWGLQHLWQYQYHNVMTVFYVLCILLRYSRCVCLLTIYLLYILLYIKLCILLRYSRSAFLKLLQELKIEDPSRLKESGIGNFINSYQPV